MPPKDTPIGIVPTDDPSAAFIGMRLSARFCSIPSSVVDPAKEFSGVEVVVCLFDSGRCGHRRRHGDMRIGFAFILFDCVADD